MLMIFFPSVLSISKKSKAQGISEAIERLSDKLHFYARYGGRKQKRELRLLHPHLIWNRTLYLAFGLLIEAAESIRSRVYSLNSRNIKCHAEF